LEELERRAAADGATIVRLETNETLGEAIALYRSAGYVEVDAFNDEPYAHPLVREASRLAVLHVSARASSLRIPGIERRRESCRSRMTRS
jgi:ribosomal protein S18 acetylase RimI-like enzyme